MPPTNKKTMTKKKRKCLNLPQHMNMLRHKPAIRTLYFCNHLPRLTIVYLLFLPRPLGRVWLQPPRPWLSRWPCPLPSRFGTPFLSFNVSPPLFLISYPNNNLFHLITYDLMFLVSNLLRMVSFVIDQPH